MKLTKTQAAHQAAGLVYCLWLLGFLFGITAIIGIAISHINLKKARGTDAYSHFIWQIGSFWVIFVGAVLAYLNWPSGLSKIIIFACFAVWLFTGLFGSWHLTKSRKIKLISRKIRTQPDSQAPSIPL